MVGLGIRIPEARGAWQAAYGHRLVVDLAQKHAGGKGAFGNGRKVDVRGDDEIAEDRGHRTTVPQGSRCKGLEIGSPNRLRIRGSRKQDAYDEPDETEITKRTSQNSQHGLPFPLIVMSLSETFPQCLALPARSQAIVHSAWGACRGLMNQAGSGPSWPTPWNGVGLLTAGQLDATLTSRRGRLGNWTIFRSVPIS